MGLVISVILELIRDIKGVFHEVFGGHGCHECDCANYDDGGLFEGFKSRSELTTYAEEMVDSGVMGRALSCGCGHLREKHRNLERRLLTADAVPNGGVVHAELLKRAEAKRNQERALRLARDARAVAKRPSEVQIEEIVEGDGKAIRNGDDILMHYIVFVKGCKVSFDSSKQGVNLNKIDDDDDEIKRNEALRDAFRMTVGNGTVVEGLDRGLLGARVGGKRRILIPAHLAFGNSDVGGHRNADIEFIVEIVAILST